jgi:OmcA/MtrC family decaheme c-type cytochrome
VKYSDLSSKNRSLCHWINFAAASLLAVALTGCGGGGGGGSSDTTAAAPAAGGGAAPVVAAPTGAAPITLTAATPAATFAALTPAVPAVSVTIASPPKVTFSLTDGNGNAIKGFGSKSQSATATLASYPNLSFALAKLIPEQVAVLQGKTLTTPSRWVSYIVTTVPTFKSATDKTVVASVPTRPTTDNTGTLVDNGNGTYTYTFSRDITKAKDAVAAAAETATNKNADLDDLTFDPNAVHRLTIQISGNAPGTGSNTSDGVTVTPGVPMANPLNVIYDFIPATGKQVTDSGREITATSKCNDCHQSLGGFPTASAADSDATFHGGNRNNTQYCVVCHTDQRKYGQPEATLVGVNYDGKNTYRINGLGVGNLKTHIHKIHMSEGLTKTGYNYGGVIYETACRFPQDVRNCTKCHDGSATSTAQTTQGDNWKNVPNRAACGACHDGINFNTGTGTTLADFKAGNAATSAGHAGGAQLDDSACAFCHTAATIDVNHIPVTPPNPLNALLLNPNSVAAIAANPSLASNANSNGAFIASNTSRLPAGAIKVTYEIQSTSRNASKQPVMVFRMLQNGVATAFNVSSATKTEMWDNFIGSPSVYFVFAVPQDGITAPADFNGSASSYLRSLWNGKATGTGAGTLSSPDASGFYTATLTGVTIPDSAVMLTGGLGYSYNVTSTQPLTQTNVPGYPTAAPTTPNALNPVNPNLTGGLIVVAPDQQKVATGYTGRRPIVDDNLCNKCHQELGPFTEDAFHAGQRNDGSTCAWCHNPNQNNGGWSGDSTAFVHAIHAAAKRTVKDTWHAVSATDGFYQIGYPGILKKCETCHIAGGGTYDFSATASTSALPNRLYRTVATGTFASASTSAFSFSPYVTLDAPTLGTAFSFSAATGVTTPATATTLVNSPIATACFACHDDALAMAHIRSNGGSLYAARTTALATPEQCTLCHLTGKVADIKVMHQ